MSKTRFVAFATQKGGIGKSTITALVANYIHNVKMCIRDRINGVCTETSNQYKPIKETATWNTTCLLYTSEEN